MKGTFWSFKIMATGLMLGIWLQEQWSWPIAVLSAALFGWLALGYFSRPWKVWFRFWILVLWVGIGVGYSHVYQARVFPALLEEVFLKKQPVTVTGEVDSEVRTRAGISGTRVGFELAIRAIEVNGQWQPSRGRVWVRLYKEHPIRYRQSVVLSGRLVRPYEFKPASRFSYRQYLRRNGIHYILSVKKDAKVNIVQSASGLMPVVLGVRRWLSGLLTSYLSPSEAGLMQALLLGERTNMSDYVRDLFARTGTAHVLPA